MCKAMCLILSTTHTNQTNNDEGGEERGIKREERAEREGRSQNTQRKRKKAQMTRKTLFGKGHYLLIHFSISKLIASLGSVVKHLPSMQDTLGIIPRIN